MLALNTYLHNDWGRKRDGKLHQLIAYCTEFCPEFTCTKTKSSLHRAWPSFSKIGIFTFSLGNKWSVSRFSFGCICSLGPLRSEFTFQEKEVSYFIVKVASIWKFNFVFQSLPSSCKEERQLEATYKSTFPSLVAVSWELPLTGIGELTGILDCFCLTVLRFSAWLE